jgi:hypothetical protein
VPKLGQDLVSADALRHVVRAIYDHNRRGTTGGPGSRVLGLEASVGCG